MNKRWTRKQYVDKEVSHEEYWQQYSSPAYTEYVLEAIGTDDLILSEDPHLNDIPLQRWYNLARPSPITAMIYGNGEANADATWCCIAKHAVLPLIPELKLQALLEGYTPQSNRLKYKQGKGAYYGQTVCP